MKKTAILLMLITVFTKIFGFVREITLAYFYGVSNISDAFLISLTIPITLFSLVGSGIATSFIPMYSKIAKEKSAQAADRFTSILVSYITIIATLIVCVVLIFTAPIVNVFASGFTGDTLELAISFTRISIFGIYFSGLIFVYSGYLQIHNSFIIPAIAGIPLNLGIIISIALSKQFDVMVLSIGSTISLFLQLSVLLAAVLKYGYRFKFILDRKDMYIKQMMYLSIPVIIGVTVDQINVMVGKTLASKITVGGISALSYANLLILFIQGLFVSSIITVIYPMLSRLAAQQDMPRLRYSVLEALNIVSILVVPASVGMMVFAEPIVKSVFARGAFDVEAIKMTSDALFFYSLGMLGFGFREVLSKVFYSLQDVRTPMFNAVLAMAINIALNAILSDIYGLSGLALATSISAVFGAISLLYKIKNKLEPFPMKGIIVSLSKVLGASIIMASLAKFSFSNMIGSFRIEISLFSSVILGIMIYLVLIYAMRVEGVEGAVNKLVGRMKQ